MNFRLLLMVVLAANLMEQMTSGSPVVSNLSRDEQVLFFPAFATLEPDGKHWRAEIRGCVFEHEERKRTLSLLMKSLQLKGVELSPEEQARLQHRARLFLVDNQRNKQVVATLAGTTHVFPKTGPDGVFSGVVLFPTNGLPKADGATIEISATLKEKDGREFTGSVRLLQPGGTTVISDIDDTIKITGVGNTREVLRNTLLEVMRPIPGMPERLRTFQSQGAAFVYLSASPWQLYLPLSEFVQDAGFPAGSFVLKEFRLKDRTRYNLGQSPWEYKLPRLESLISQQAKRSHILVGDSSEQDPEIYGEVARRNPEQVIQILIRDPEGRMDENRKLQAFRGVPEGKVTIFR